MTGIAPLGRRMRAGIAGWLKTLSGDPVFWDDEDITAPDTAYWGLSEQGLSAGWSYREIRAPLTSLDLVLTPEYGTAHTYTLDVGDSPFEFTLTPDHLAADLPDVLAAAWTLSGFGLAGWSLTPVDVERFRLAAPAAGGGLPGLAPGWGVELAEPVYAADHEITVWTGTLSVLATYWGAIRARGVALSKCAQIAQVQGDEPWIHLLKQRTGSMMSRVGAPRYLGQLQVSPEAAAKVGAGECDFDLTAVRVSAAPVITVAGTGTTFQEVQT